MAEFAARHTVRYLDTIDQMDALAKATGGKRLMYADLTAGPQVADLGDQPSHSPTPGVGDDRRRLGGEHRQGLLVGHGELGAAVLVAHEDVAHSFSPVEHGRCQEAEGPHREGVGELRETRVPDVVRQVGQAQGFGDIGLGLEELLPVGGEPQLLCVGGGETGSQAVAHPAPVV